MTSAGGCAACSVSDRITLPQRQERAFNHHAAADNYASRRGGCFHDRGQFWSLFGSNCSRSWSAGHPAGNTQSLYTDRCINMHKGDALYSACMSACCSLDAFLRRAPMPSPSLPDRPGCLRAHASHQAHNHPGVYQPGPTPRILQPYTAPARAGKGCSRAAGHASSIREPAPVVPGLGYRSSD